MYRATVKVELNKEGGSYEIVNEEAENAEGCEEGEKRLGDLAVTAGILIVEKVSPACIVAAHVRASGRRPNELTERELDLLGFKSVPGFEFLQEKVNDILADLSVHVIKNFVKV